MCLQNGRGIHKYLGLSSINDLEFFLLKNKVSPLTYPTSIPGAPQSYLETPLEQQQRKKFKFDNRIIYVKIQALRIGFLDALFSSLLSYQPPSFHPRSPPPNDLTRSPSVPELYFFAAVFLK